MSSTPVNNDPKSLSSQQNTNTKPASGAASPFNYAAAAAKSKQPTAQSSPADAVSRSGTPGSATPASGPSAAANGANDSRRQSAVSMAKGGVKSGPAGGINFGSVHDSSAALSSSPAVQPKSGQHLQGDKPALFGSVEAANDSKQKIVGFAGKDGAPAPRQPVDFQKLFQGNKAAAKSAQTPASAVSQQPPSSASVTASSSDSQPAAPAAAEATPSPSLATRNGVTTAKSPPVPGPAGTMPSSGHGHPAAQSFEPARSPSQQFNHGTRGMSGGIPPFHPQGSVGPGVPQQARSPHLGSPAASAMPMQQSQQQQQQQQQPMMGAHAAHWGYHPGQPVYHPMAAAYTYYPASPHAPWTQQQPSYEGAGTPRSPRVSNIASPHPSSVSVVPTTPSSVASPASTRAQAAPFSPSTPHTSIASPSLSHSGHVGHPHPSGPPRHFQMPSGSYGHAHTPSYGANAMSPSARHFEPTKRQSSAIRIVNPETNTAIDVKSASKSNDVAGAAKSDIAAKETSNTTSAPATATATPSQIRNHQTANHFSEMVRDKVKERNEAAEAAKKKEAAAAAAAEEEQRKKKADADAEAARLREEEEKAAAARKEAEAKAASEEAERKEREAKEAAAAQEREAREKAEAEAAAAAKQKSEEDARRKAEEETARQTVDKATAADGAIATEKVEEARLEAEHATAAGEQSGVEAGKDAAAGMTTSRSVADIERMAREASSVPSTPLETTVNRTPLFPTTPRTPGGTPGFAGLPAKPLSSMATPASNGTITLDSAQLEKRRRPAQLDTAAAQQTNSADAPPMSAASQSLGSARFIDDLTKVAYPESIQSPRAELNQSAEPGKFRYDRDFLLQFMGVYSEKPQDMPSLASIGMEQGQMGAGGRGAPGRRSSQMGPPGAGAGGRGQGFGVGAGGAFGRGAAGAGGMGQFAHPPKTSEERFAQSNAGLRPGGAFATSGPMGAFTAGSRTQPLSRGGSGSSGALPSREMMGTGVPAGGRTASRRGRQREPGSGRGGDRVNPPEKGGPTIPLDQVVPLAHSDNRWQAGSGAKIGADSPELVQRKVKALLNKLTVEKFASISDQILEWANKSTEETDGRTLRQVIALIFEKATDEAAWSEMYAQLCRKLQEKISSDISDENLRSGDGKPVAGGMLFRKYLLNRCQEDFERGWDIRDAMVDAAKSKEAEDKAKKQSNEKAEADAKEAAERGEQTEQKEAELMSDEYYAAAKAKRRGLGLVRFIGELFKLSMLTEKIMHLCIKKLLSNALDPEEEEIESLCKLLTTVGRQLDTEKARGHIDVYFQRIKEMSKSESINSRMRFMLLDVIEMRGAGWKGKQEAAGPKSIAQIHEDAAKQKQQAEAELAARSRGGPPSRGGSRRGQQRGDFPGPGQAVGPDGWTSVGGAPPPPRPTRAGDMSAFGKIERSGSGRPLSLGMGPNSFFAKKQQKSSEDGSKPPSRTSSSANMFEMLGQAENEQGQSSGRASGGASERPQLNLAPRTKPLPQANGTTGSASEGAEDGDDQDDDEEEGEGDGEDEDEEPKELDDSAASRKISEDVKEFFQVKSVEEGLVAMKSLPTSRRGQFVAAIIETVLNKKEDDVRLVGKLFTGARESSRLSDADFETGFKDAGIAMLDDIAIDVPSVYNFMAILLVSSGLPSENVEALASLVEGEGITPPKQKLLQKVEAESKA
ncbi:unnamed protein product [Parajaminaea phylloscopi]